MRLPDSLFSQVGTARGDAPPAATCARQPATRPNKTTLHARSTPSIHQSGAAVIAALLVVALVAVVASTLLARQSQALIRVEGTLSRAQLSQYGLTGLQWARGILAEDARNSAIDHLGEVWARPLAALPVENAVASGRISDAQGRFNLNNLVRNNRASDPDIARFKRLLEQLQLNPDLANAIADWIDPDAEPHTAAGAEDAWYLAQRDAYRAANRPLVSVEELIRVRGMTAEALAKLRPHVAALPVNTPINPNTATAEVLAALLPDIPEPDRIRLLRERQARPFDSLEDLRKRHPQVPQSLTLQDADLKSQFFIITFALTAGSAEQPLTLAQEALLRREGNSGWPVIIRVQPL